MTNRYNPMLMGLLIGFTIVWLHALWTYLPLPDVPHHYWRRDLVGATLYTEAGEEAASFIGTFFDSAQVCTQEETVPITCKHFETNKEALRWLTQVYGEKR